MGNLIKMRKTPSPLNKAVIDNLLKNLEISLTDLDPRPIRDRPVDALFTSPYRLTLKTAKKTKYLCGCVANSSFFMRIDYFVIFLAKQKWMC